VVSSSRSHPNLNRIRFHFTVLDAALGIERNEGTTLN
jgi:hypothetical protein